MRALQDEEKKRIWQWFSGLAYVGASQSEGPLDVETPGYLGRIKGSVLEAV